MAKRQEFKTEVRQLLQLMIHSLYSNRDIFLRELVANAADAIDKARIESLTDSAQSRDWQIRIEADKNLKTLTISENGIGMTEQEVIDNIGTIAQSGTRAFMQMLEEKGAKGEDIPELIGQFGVGFYSAFMVASEVTVITKKSGSDAPAVMWKSQGEGDYELDDAQREEPGTTITLKLKEDCESYLENWKVGSIIRKYSDFISYPIVMPRVTVNEDKTETVTDEVLNSQKAIWLRKPSEVTEDEYKSFYSHLANYGGTEYLKAIHMSAEGISEFKALLFLPKQAPFNFLMPDIQKKGLQLYVKRVFITDECKALLPDYLRFVCGVVDSSDLPLNVSREILQENPIISKIEKAVTSRVISELKKLLENDRDSYNAFFAEFGRVLKEGLHTDFTNVEKLKDVVMYESMNSEPGKYITLAEYVDTMPEGQNEIFYITGEKRAALDSYPGLDYFKSKGWDVLFMTDPIDDWVMQSMMQYRKHNFKSIAKGDFEDKESEDAVKAANEKYADLTAFIKETLGDKLSEVRFSGRMTDSPCCLIVEGNALAPHIERLFKAMHQQVPETKRIFELNPKHPLVEKMDEALKSGKKDEAELCAKVMFNQALITEGSPLDDPAGFAKSVTELLVKSL